MNRLYGTNVASSYDSMQAHIAKHQLGITPEEYIAIGDELTGGKEGKFSGAVRGRNFTAVVDGRVCLPSPDSTTAIFGLLRSIRRGT